MVERVQRLRDLHEEAREVCRKKFTSVTVTSARLVRDASIVAIRRWPAVYRASISSNLDRPPEVMAVDLCFVGPSVLDGLRAMTLAGHPNDLNAVERSVDLLEALGGLPAEGAYTIARFDIGWRCWDRAVDDRTRGRIALILARTAGPDWLGSRSGIKITRTLLTAAVTLLSPSTAPEQLADASALLADAEACSKHYALAAHIDKQVAYNLPFTRAWGRATFNAGHWMRITGNHAEAIYLLELLLSSQVDDEEEGPNILELCMNYRHYAAIEVSKCYEGQRLYRRAYDWMNLALSKYYYHSMCGNCADAAAQQVRKEMERLARRAGFNAR